MEGLLTGRGLVGWEDIFIVSRVTFIAQGEPERGADVAVCYESPVLGGPIVISKARGQKCERCWKYSEEVKADSNPAMVCGRCATVLKSGVSK